MGSGRARAKQAKVARELKYYSPETDLAALQRELSHDQHAQADWDAVAEEHDGEYTEASSKD